MNLSDVSGWILRSVNEHFLNALPRHVHFEGWTRQTEDKRNWFEVRLDGPAIKWHAQDNYKATLMVNILAMCPNSDGNRYEIRDMIAEATDALPYAIPVYKYGIGPLDDGTQFGCLTQKKLRDKEDDYDIAYFGQAMPARPIEQASVEMDYNLRFSLGG